MPRPEVFSERKSSSMMTIGKAEAQHRRLRSGQMAKARSVADAGAGRLHSRRRPRQSGVQRRWTCQRRPSGGWLAGVAVAAELATGTFYLLMLAHRASPPRRSRRTWAPACRAQLVVGGGRRRRRTALGWHWRRQRQPPRRRRAPNRDVNLDIGERVHVAAWNADGTATRAATAARPGQRALARPAARRAPGEHVIRAVDGNRLRARPLRPSRSQLTGTAHGNRRPRHPRHRRDLRRPHHQDRAAAERLGASSGSASTTAR